MTWSIVDWREPNVKSELWGSPRASKGTNWVWLKEVWAGRRWRRKSRNFAAIGEGTPKELQLRPLIGQWLSPTRDFQKKHLYKTFLFQCILFLFDFIELLMDQHLSIEQRWRCFIHSVCTVTCRCICVCLYYSLFQLQHYGSVNTPSLHDNGTIDSKHPGCCWYMICIWCIQSSV